MARLKSSPFLVCCDWDFSRDGGAVSTINLGEFLPPNTTTIRTLVRVVTPFAGVGASMSVGVSGVSTTFLLAATAVGSFTPAGTVVPANTPVYTSAGGQITVTISGADFTAGRAVITVQGVQNDF